MTKELKQVARKTQPDRAQEIVGFANELKKIIVERRLFVNVKGKNYPLVEAWQIAGALCDIYPMVRVVKNISDEQTIRYRAEVELVDGKGNIVGAGMAVCTNKEAGKRAFEEFAVASMAQTRAVGKAFRLKLGWLVKLAGYEPTPAEEIVPGKVEEAPEPPEEKDWAGEMRRCSMASELFRVWLKIPNDKKPELEELKNELKAKLV